MLRHLFHPALLVPAVLACSSPTAPSAEGSWGGPEASLFLTRSGGTLSYACGAGTIDPTWTLTRHGGFAATGQHFFGGGPLPPQGHPPHPARYTGRLQGAELVLTVTLTDLDQTLGPYRLARGGPVVSEQCL
jgi:hypothetical protein